MHHRRPSLVRRLFQAISLVGTSVTRRRINCRQRRVRRGPTAWTRQTAASVPQAVQLLECRRLLAAAAGGAPEVVLSKGIVASSAADAGFDAAIGPADVVFAPPRAAAIAFTGLLNSQNLRTASDAIPVDANLTNARVGDTLRFAIVLENQSTSGGAFDVTVRDVLPASVSYVANSLQVVSGSGTALSYVDLTSADDGSGLFASGIRLDDPGASPGRFGAPLQCGALDALTDDSAGGNIAVLVYDAVVQNSVGSTSTFVSDATLVSYAATEGGSNLSTQSTDTASLSLERIDLELTTFVSNTAPLAGDIITWTVQVTNNQQSATVAATGVQVVNIVPAGQSLVSGSAVPPVGDTFTEATGLWSLNGSLAPGETRTLTLQTVAAQSVVLPQDVVDLELSASEPATDLSAGETLTYTVTVTNHPAGATTAATGLTIADLLPTGVTFLSETATAGVFDASRGIWDLSSVALDRGQSETLTLTVGVDTAAAGSPLELAAEVATLNEADIDATPANNSTTEDDDASWSVTVAAALTVRTISGRAFFDTDNNGTNSGETGVSGIQVTARDAEGLVVGTAVTDATGGYTLAAIPSGDVRLEFTGFAADASLTTAQSPPASASTVSSLAFVDAGTSDVTANLALYRPPQAASFVTTCFIYSGQSALDPTTEPAVVAFRADGSLKTTLATIADVGATNGLAVHPFSNDQFVAAFQKRHADTGPSGNSAIYRIDAAGVVSTFIRLDDIFGADYAGPYSHDPTNWFADAPAFGTTGRIALGDLDISADGRFLYTINLATRELIEIPVSTSVATDPEDYVAGDSRTVRRFPILGDNATTPANGGIATSRLGVDPEANIRPFALTVKDGLVYVGLVNSAESTTFTSDLNAYVFPFDPNTQTFAATAAASFPLGSRTTGGGWQAWTSDWEDLPKFYDAAGDFFAAGRNQPWLTDIAFDDNDDMILGFRDRTGDEVGHMVGDPTAADTDGIGGPDRFFHDTKGDILRLRQTTSSTWAVEPGQLAGDGTEYYQGDEATFEPVAAVLHPESAQGGLARIPGHTNIVTTAIDPQSFWAGGVISLDNGTGEQTDQLDIYSGSDAADILSFGKNNGLGDLESLDRLFQEVGSRLWQDLNGNGRQDAGEPPLANVDLQLLDMSGPPRLVGTTTSDAAGQYFFNNSNVAYTDGGPAVGLRPLTDYRIQIAQSEFQTSGSLFGFEPTNDGQSRSLIDRTVQSVSGAAEFDTNQDLVADTARNQRIDLLTAVGLRADGVRVRVTNAIGGLARVDTDQSVLFEFTDGRTTGSFEYEIVDDRTDSDAVALEFNGDRQPDEVFISFRSGAAGWTDHSFDFGLLPAPVDVSLRKTSSRLQVAESDEVRLTITVTNNADARRAASGIVVRDTLPSGLTLVAGSIATSQGTLTGSDWILSSPLAPGESATLEYRATVSAAIGSVLISPAEVRSLNEADVDSAGGNDDGDRSEDDEADAVLLVGRLGGSTAVFRSQVVAADQSDFDSTPDNDNHDASEDDESEIRYTLSPVTNVFDYGDLPDVYRTTIAAGGPAHRRGTSTFLGASVDDEPDGQPTPTASGDGNDDDGVRFLTPLLPGATATLEVSASTDGFLNAWIDFDADGTLDELQIATRDGVSTGGIAAADLALTAGTHLLSVVVPSTAGGSMAARFRYTRDAMGTQRSPGGSWLNGEVEDYLLREVGGTVWFDHDSDGRFDSGPEAGLPAVTVVLSADLNADGTTETWTTVTDASGGYRFSGVPTGDYRVTVRPPSATVATFDVDGGADDLTRVLLNAVDGSRTDVDFGYRGTGRIGDRIWQDVNANGIVDGLETGLAGISVSLTGDLNGNGQTDITQTTITNSHGRYTFADLVAGDYTISVIPAADMTPTFDADSIASPHVSRLALTHGTENLSQDFGYRPTGNTGVIGDLVWEDANGDGVRDDAERGLDGLLVRLSGDTNGDGANDVTRSTTTDDAGQYEFTALPAGTWTVTITPPTDGSPTFDADGVTSANMATVVLAAQTQNRTLDFGYRFSADASVDLSVQKESDAAGDSAAVGSTVVYSVRVTNSGPEDAVDARLTDNLPAAFDSASWVATGSAGSSFVSVGTGSLNETLSLPAGGHVTYTITATLSDAFTGSVTNTATVTAASGQTETDVTNNQSTDTLQVTPLTLTPETAPLPGAPFQVGARGMSHVALVPFVVGSIPGSGTINGVRVDIADPQVFMVGFVCVDDRIIAVYDIPENLNGQTLYFQAYESAPVPRVSNLIKAVVGAPQIQVQESGNGTAVTEASTTDSVSVSLSAAITGTVTLDIQNERPDRVAVGASALTFTADNWNIPQTLNLAAVDDGQVNGDERTNVVLKVRSGSDASYDSAFSRTIRVAVVDDDVLSTPGVTRGHTTTVEQQPQITWSRVAAADSYDIWVSPSHDVGRPSDNTTVRGTTFTPAAPLGIGRHAVWVRARTDAGLVSAWSAAATIDVVTAPKVSLSSLTFDQRTTLSWDPVAGAARYEVWINNTTQEISRTQHSTSVTETSFTTAELSFGEHAVWVRAINDHGRAGGWSMVAKVSVIPEPLTPGSTFDRRPEFTWTVPPEAATFEIYVRSDSEILQEAGLTAAVWRPATILQNNTDYRWWVRGRTASGQAGPWSSVQLARIGGRPTQISPETGEQTTARPEFRWTSVDGFTTYDLFVYRVDQPGLAFRITDLTARVYTHSAALAAGDYRVWVRALSRTGLYSPWSSPTEFRIL